MNSEKVKKIKKDIEICMKSLNCNGCSHHSQRSGECCRNLTNDILTYINELESENERLKHLREVDNTTMTTLRKSNTELNECMDEMQDRIAELEKEIKENLSYAKGYADGIKNTYEAMLPQKLENFIKRLKEKDLSVPLHKDFMIIDNKAIDETLKEFGL